MHNLHADAGWHATVKHNAGSTATEVTQGPAGDTGLSGDKAAASDAGLDACMHGSCQDRYVA